MLIGLAHNDQNGYFHWATDLGRDVEILFLSQQYPIQPNQSFIEIEPKYNKRKKDKNLNESNKPYKKRKNYILNN